MQVTDLHSHIQFYKQQFDRCSWCKIDPRNFCFTIHRCKLDNANSFFCFICVKWCTIFYGVRQHNKVHHQEVLETGQFSMRCNTCEEKFDTVTETIHPCTGHISGFVFYCVWCNDWIHSLDPDIHIAHHFNKRFSPVQVEEPSPVKRKRVTPEMILEFEPLDRLQELEEAEIQRAIQESLKNSQPLESSEFIKAMEESIKTMETRDFKNLHIDFKKGTIQSREDVDLDRAIQASMKEAKMQENMMSIPAMRSVNRKDIRICVNDIYDNMHLSKFMVVDLGFSDIIQGCRTEQIAKQRTRDGQIPSLTLMCHRSMLHRMETESFSIDSLINVFRAATVWASDGFRTMLGYCIGLKWPAISDDKDYLSLPPDQKAQLFEYIRPKVKMWYDRIFFGRSVEPGTTEKFTSCFTMRDRDKFIKLIPILSHIKSLHIQKYLIDLYQCSKTLREKMFYDLLECGTLAGVILPLISFEETEQWKESMLFADIHKRAVLYTVWDIMNDNTLQQFASNKEYGIRLSKLVTEILISQSQGDMA
jgi:hypothetical protein